MLFRSDDDDIDDIDDIDTLFVNGILVDWIDWMRLSSNLNDNQLSLTIPDRLNTRRIFVLYVQ